MVLEIGISNRMLQEFYVYVQYLPLGELQVPFPSQKIIQRVIKKITCYRSLSSVHLILGICMPINMHMIKNTFTHVQHTHTCTHDCQCPVKLCNSPRLIVVKKFDRLGSSHQCALNSDICSLVELLPNSAS